MDLLHRSPIGRTWRLIVAALSPIIRPFTDPLQRWDDGRRARRLRETAGLIEQHFPHQAAELQALAVAIAPRS